MSRAANVRAVVATVLDLVGFVAIITAAALVSTALGLLVAGIVALVVSWALSGRPVPRLRGSDR